MAIPTGNPASPMAIVHYFVDQAGNTQQASAETPFPSVFSATIFPMAVAAGTTTIEPGGGTFFGATVVTAGTNSSIQFFDGTQAFTPVMTNTAIGAVSLGVPGGVGIAYTTNLVLVTAGTAVSTAVAFVA
jgi:hypothetical protein